MAKLVSSTKSVPLSAPKPMRLTEPGQWHQNGLSAIPPVSVAVLVSVVAPRVSSCTIAIWPPAKEIASREGSAVHSAANPDAPAHGRGMDGPLPSALLVVKEKEARWLETASEVMTKMSSDG